MSLSVALCTYNGAKYIESQLRSILEQTVPVGEVVVCDDGSTDGTVEIIKAISKQTEIPISIYINNPNLGVCANFDKAIKLCKGDLIFLSDQDDIWMPNKVETVQRWFEDHPEKEAVYTDAVFMDSEGNAIYPSESVFSLLGMTLLARKWFEKGFALELFMKTNRAVGATMAIRSSLIGNYRLDYTATSSNFRPLHDFLIATSAIERESLGFIDKSLIKYRLHNGQNCGLEYYLQHPARFDDIYDRKYGWTVIGNYLTRSKYIRRWEMTCRRVFRTADSWRYVLSCIKDFPNYIFVYQLRGLKMFVNDLLSD